MAELRRDPLTGRVVLLAPGRSARPFTTVAAAATGASAAECPFCPGHEDRTPPEVARTGPGAPDTPGWRVRVFPNLYPMVAETERADPAGPHGRGRHWSVVGGAGGTHEVAVLSPDHARTFARLGDDEAIEVLGVVRSRTRAHAAAGRAYVQVLVNEGRAAGASIAHPHAQLVALDLVPPEVEHRLTRFESAGADLVLEDLADAHDAGLVVLDGPAPVWCPAASTRPFEMRLAAPDAGPAFAEATDEQVAATALALRDALARLAAVGDPAYNVVVHDGPTRTVMGYHWHVQIAPRAGVVAGFELGTGIMVNTVAPDDAAQRLRDARDLPGANRQEREA